MPEEVAERVGENRLTFVQGVAMSAVGLTFGASAGIAYAAGELGATTCPIGSTCPTIQSLQLTTYQLLGVAILGLVVAFGTHVLLDALEESSQSSD